MIYGRFFDFFFLIFLPAFILILNQEAESLHFEETTTNVAAPNSVDLVSHAFVQTDSELHYFRDVSHQDILLSSISEFDDRQVRKYDSKKTPKNVPLFEQKLTDFGATFVGVPISRKIFVKNPTNSKLTFNAITSSANAFHCSFFVDKVLKPQQWTNFNVLFLPAEEGIFEELIFVHTSIGKISHKVCGDAVGNPYRIRSFFDIKLPTNETYVAPIIIHNPHFSVMKVIEVFSSDSNVQVEFVEKYVRSGMSRIWEIAPFETRNIVNVNVLGNLERNMKSFLYVKFLLKNKYLTNFILSDSAKSHNFQVEGDKNQSDEDNDIKVQMLVIPIEVQVLSKKGIFSDNIFDFGIIKEGEKSHQILFKVYSNIEKGVEIESIYVANDNRMHGIHMQFASKPPLSVKCGARNQPGAAVPIANINLSTSLNVGKDDSIIVNEKLYKKQGKIVAESRGGNYNVIVPYKALIYKGEILHNAENVAFYNKLIPPISRDVQLTNNFSFSLGIWNVTIADNGKDIFEVKLIKPIVVLLPQQTLSVLIVKYLRQQSSSFTTYCTIHTNVSSYNIPIFVFDAKLEVTFNSLSRRIFDFGYMAAGEHRSILMTIKNRNSVPIVITKLQNPLPSFTLLQFQSIFYEDGKKSGSLYSQNDLSHFDFWTAGMDFTVLAHSMVVFNYTFIAPSTNNSFVKSNLNFVFQTNYDKFRFPIVFRTTSKSLINVPQLVEFRNSFIGTVHSTDLKVYSTFEEDLSIYRLSLLGNDPRFFLSKLAEKNDGLVKAGTISSLAKLTFAPQASCLENSNNNDCYVGFPLDTADGQWFTYGLKLPQNLAEIDSYLYGRLRRKWAALTAKKINTTVMLDTSTVKNFEIPVQASLIWPKLLSHSVVRFPLTAVGNFTIVNLTLDNPSNRPIVVQLLPLVIYPDAEAMLDFFRGEFPAPLIEPVEMNETLMFSLRDTELFTLKPGSPVPKLREELENVIGTQVPRFTLSMILHPGMKTRIRIGFLPSDYTLRSSLLLIRNNLTGIEPVVLYGQGAQIRMEIDNKTARNSDPLLFDIQTLHLSDCRNPKRLMNKLPTTLTVKRSFTVKNKGSVSFSVVNMSINNMPCENRGFRILNCLPFRLEPNESMVLDIAYTPDFLMAFNDASLLLYMHMNGTPWVFDLSASIPRHMLSMCHAALPRPAFENVMYYMCLLALMFCLICVIACSYLEADRIISCAIRQIFIGGQDRKVFDLNSTCIVTSNNNNSVTNDNQNFSPTRAKKTIFNFNLSSIFLRPVHYRNYVQISPNATFSLKLFLRFANNVLWLFSHFWIFFRGAHDSTDSTLTHNRHQENHSKKIRKLVNQNVLNKSSVIEQSTIAGPSLHSDSGLNTDSPHCNLTSYFFSAYFPTGDKDKLVQQSVTGQQKTTFCLPYSHAGIRTTFSVDNEICKVNDDFKEQKSTENTNLSPRAEKKIKSLKKRVQRLSSQSNKNYLPSTTDASLAGNSSGKSKTILKQNVTTTSIIINSKKTKGLSSLNAFKPVADVDTIIPPALNPSNSPPGFEPAHIKSNSGSECSEKSSFSSLPFVKINAAKSTSSATITTTANISKKLKSVGADSYCSSQCSTQSKITPTTMNKNCETKSQNNHNFQPIKNASLLFSDSNNFDANTSVKNENDKKISKIFMKTSKVSENQSLIEENVVSGQSDDGSVTQMPEWAKSSPIHLINVDEEFDALAVNTAKLTFDDKLEQGNERRNDVTGSVSPLSTSSFSSYLAPPYKEECFYNNVNGSVVVHNNAKMFQRTPRRPTTKISVANSTKKDVSLQDCEDTTAESSACSSEFSKQRTSKRRKKVKNENSEVERYIGILTKDYRKRLKHLIANGVMPINKDFALTNNTDLTLTLPADLTANPENIDASLPYNKMGWLANTTAAFTPSSTYYPSVCPSLMPSLFLPPSSINNPTQQRSTLSGYNQATAMNTSDYVYSTNNANSYSKTSSMQVSNNLTNVLYQFVNTSQNLGAIGSACGNSSSSTFVTSGDEKFLNPSENPFNIYNNFSSQLDSIESSSQYIGSLFNSNDPIWKPIFEEHNSPNTSNQTAASYWPANFSQESDNKQDKKPKNE